MCINVNFTDYIRYKPVIHVYINIVKIGNPHFSRICWRSSIY